VTVFSVKAIKPQRMRVDAIRLEVLNALRAEGRDVKKEYEKTTKTWRRKPNFEILVDVTAKDASVLVGTDDKIYGYVDFGTRPHLIRARNAPRLAFQTGFDPKTRPGVIGSGPGRRFGPTVHPVAVMHPGGKARKFSETIQKRRRKKFTRRMIKAIQSGAQNLY
jgi:hypothetical protein